MNISTSSIKANEVSSEYADHITKLREFLQSFNNQEVDLDEASKQIPGIDTR